MGCWLALLAFRAGRRTLVVVPPPLSDLVRIGKNHPDRIFPYTQVILAYIYLICAWAAFFGLHGGQVQSKRPAYRL